jgi:hypothetical protein
MRTAWIVANVVAIGTFLLFAALQINDPDPWLWIPIYAVPALLSGLALAGRLPRWAPFVVAPLAVLATLPLLPTGIHADPGKVVSDMGMHAAGVEEAREAIGLLLIAAWCVVLGVVRAPR